MHAAATNQAHTHTCYRARRHGEPIGLCVNIMDMCHAVISLLLWGQSIFFNMGYALVIRIGGGGTFP